MAVLLVAAGGAAGALLRFGTYRLIDSQVFPWATFAVNVIGCFLASLLIFGLGAEMSYEARSFLFVGVFGAFTTMSAMSLETVDLMVAGNYAYAALNVSANVGLCLLGAILGRILAVSAVL
ncbi:hypothetical protein AOA81_03380 [Methanomassiliicoccales archaeon RumEn M2]|nr:hypothetical protein AOA81_03380 [Methanomassiliicoccales archaeon RumEn M2]